MSARYDCAVIGGGPAGVAAALKSARGGNRTLLVERYGFAGGMATAGMVNPFAGNCYVNPETGAAGDVVDGVFGEVLQRLRARGAAERYLFHPGQPRYYDAFDERQLRIVYDELLAEAGVEVLFHAWLLDAQVSGGHVDSVRLRTKGGVETVEAKAFIDSTGDADLAAAAEVPFDVGRAEDGLCQPCTLMFRMAGVDKDGLLDAGLKVARERVTGYFEDARNAGRLDFPFRDWVAFYEYPRPGCLQFNMTRVCERSALDARQLSAAEREGRRQADVFSRWLAAEVPWFKHAYLETMGTQIGVRETRRIRGQYSMSAGDIREGARFDDGIARSGYFIDIHNPKGATDPHAAAATRGVPKDNFRAKRYYEVPFRCLQPLGVSNLLVACRGISTSFEAHAAVRVMATMHAVGEAAGAAAAMAVKDGAECSAIDGVKVRRSIAYLNRELAF